MDFFNHGEQDLWFVLYSKLQFDSFLTLIFDFDIFVSVFMIQISFFYSFKNFDFCYLSKVYTYDLAFIMG